MSTRLTSVCFDAADPGRLAGFWATALGWNLDDLGDGVWTLTSTDGTPFDLDFLPVSEPATGKSRVHLDFVADSRDEQAAMVDRLVGLGASHANIGQGAVDWTVLADPEGNEFCVVMRGEFLATTGLLGEIVFEPASYPEVGRFWSEATGWPIVFDDGTDLAIRDAEGTGPFIVFGPPSGAPKVVKNRLHLDVAPPVTGELHAEVDRLIALGARPVDVGQGEVPWTVLADPDGNEFCVLTPR